MTTTIALSFQKFKENLEITGLQKNVVSVRQQNVRNVIERKLEVLDSFLTGSYMRSTMISPLSKTDIDIFVVLDPKYYRSDGQVALLDRVRLALLETYTKTPKISRNGQAITISFTDFIVDVVPAFYRIGGGYLIPDSVQKAWIETNPKTHVELMSNENLIHDGDLVPITKMIKGWNKNINQDFVSFYLELLAIKTFQGITISDFPSGIRYFFDKGREAIKYKVRDPVEYGGQINCLENCKNVLDAVNRFEVAYSRAMKAEDYARKGYTEASINEWRKIFGDYFPAYY